MIRSLDLRGVSCPVNFVRCNLALEKLNHDDILEVQLDIGEPEEMVISGLSDKGYEIKITDKGSNWIRFLVFSNAAKK